MVDWVTVEVRRIDPSIEFPRFPLASMQLASRTRMWALKQKKDLPNSYQTAGTAIWAGWKLRLTAVPIR